MSIECGCTWDADLDCCDRWEFSTRRDARARKPHRCYECGDTIAVGDDHECVSGKLGDGFATFRTCRTCQRIRDEYCCSYIYGELRETLREMLGIDYAGEWTEDDEEYDDDEA